MLSLLTLSLPTCWLRGVSTTGPLHLLCPLPEALPQAFTWLIPSPDSGLCHLPPVRDAFPDHCHSRTLWNALVCVVDACPACRSYTGLAEDGPVVFTARMPILRTVPFALQPLHQCEKEHQRSEGKPGELVCEAWRISESEAGKGILVSGGNVGKGPGHCPEGSRKAGV